MLNEKNSKLFIQLKVHILFSQSSMFCKIKNLFHFSDFIGNKLDDFAISLEKLGDLLNTSRSIEAKLIEVNSTYEEIKGTGKSFSEARNIVRTCCVPKSTLTKIVLNVKTKQKQQCSAGILSLQFS